jgi:(2Fe-2S) ferredoxin
MTTWDLNGTRQIVLLCNGDTCTQQGADQVTLILRRALQARHLDPLVHTARTRCMGRCDDACTVVIMPDNVWYRNVTPALAERIVAEHLVGGVPVPDQVSFLPGADGLAQISGAQPGKSKRE